MTWLRDTAERVGATFIEAWLAAWAALPVVPGVENHSFDLLFSEGVLLTGLVAAALTFVKCLGAARVGTDGSASLAD